MTVERLTKLQEIFNALENWEMAENELFWALETDYSEDTDSIVNCLLNVEQTKDKLKLAWVDFKFQLQKEKEVIVEST